MKEKQAMSELEEDRVCQWSWTVIGEDEAEKGKIMFCKKHSEYRVTIYEREVMNEAGEWEKETRQEYLCKKHFDQVYRYPPSSINPPFSFRRIALKGSFYGSQDTEVSTDVGEKVWR